MLPDRCHRRRLDPERRRNIAGLVRTCSKLGHGAELFLFQCREAIKPETKEILIKVLRHLRGNADDVALRDRTARRGVPNLIAAPLLNEIGIPFRDAKDLGDRFFLEISHRLLRPVALPYRASESTGSHANPLPEPTGKMALVREAANKCNL
jgi:hypothetical protein